MSVILTIKIGMGKKKSYTEHLSHAPPAAFAWVTQYLCTVLNHLQPMDRSPLLILDGATSTEAFPITPHLLMLQAYEA